MSKLRLQEHWDMLVVTSGDARSWNFAPTAVLTKSGIVPVSVARKSSSRAATSISAARPINIAASKPLVTVAKPKKMLYIQHENSVNTAKGNKVTSVVRNKGINAVKSSSCWVWRPKIKVQDHVSKNIGSYICKRFDYGSPQDALKDQGYFNSGCSRHMTGNISYLTDFKEHDGGYVAFGGGDKGATKDETSRILKIFITEIENLVEKKVKIIRCDNGTEFKNRVMNKFYEEKGIKREYSVARTPQQNEVAERSNRTLIEAARTMLADSKLPKIGKAFRVYNIRTRKVKENLHITFLKNKPMMAGGGPEWLFDLDALLKSMNYAPVYAGTNSNDFAGKRASFDAASKSDNQESPNAESSTKTVNTAGPVNTATPTYAKYPNDPLMSDLKDVGIFDDAYDDKDEGAEADYNNLKIVIPVNPISSTRIHMDHPKKHIIGEMEPKKVTQALNDESWVEAMQEELLQFKLLNVWTLGRRQEEGIDYDEVFARIEAIRLFLAYASFIDFTIYHVKSAFLYGIIEEEVYVSQPPGFVDPEFPDRVYKVEKSLYGLHQDPRAWYETLSTYLLDNGFRRGTIDKTLFIKNIKDDILLVQVYVNDIIFGSTKRSLSTKFEQLMHKRFQMSSIGELTFFLGLQVKQRKDGIFLSQDKYVSDISKKFGFSSVKLASTPMETHKPLSKDTARTYVNVHLYRSMISSLMYLTSSRPDIMFAAKIHLDNESAICVVKNPVYHSKTKHIEIKHHFIRDSYEKRLIEIVKIHTDYNGADLLTKAFDVTSSVKYALTVSLTIHTSCIKQFWTSVKVKTINDEVRIQALVDGKRVNIKESSIRRILRLEDADGTSCLTNAEIFKGLARMGAKTTSWNEFSSTMASAIICLATNQKFNFSRFVQLIINHQLGDMTHHKDIFASPLHTKKVFANMKRVDTGFSREVTPLFDYMLVQAPEEVGILKADAQPIPIPPEPSTSKPQKKHKPKRKHTQEPEVPPVESLDEHNLPSPSYDPLPSGEDSLKLKELMDFCTNLSNKVLDLESEVIGIKSTYQARTEKLESRVERLEEENRMLKELKSVHSTVDSDEPVMEKEKSSKQGRKIAYIDTNHVVVEEVLKVVKAAKLITEVVTTFEVDVNAASVQDTLITATKVTKVNVPRKRKGVITQDPEEITIIVTVQLKLDKEVARQLEAELNADINWNAVIKQVKRSERLTDANMAGYKMDYFKGMTYDEIRPLFDKHYNYNQAFLNEVNEGVKVPKNEVSQEKEVEVESSKREGESLEEITTKQKMEQETEELKKHLQIVPDDDDVYTDATHLASKITIIDYKIHTKRNRPYFKIIRADGNHRLFMSFSIMLKNFDREDLESLWDIIRERFAKTEPKNYSDDFLLNTLKIMFENPNVEANV
nr:hypothetical protein [Tanacetum cinerariifolium]